MRDNDKLLPLEIELKKVAALGGSMALVVVPGRYADKVVAGKRDVDTAVSYQDHLLVGMIGADANEASASFLSVPKGIAVYPLDGDSIPTLFFEALERLRLQGGSHWVKRLWDNIKETNVSERKQEPEARFVSAFFYQFYEFIATHPQELGQVFTAMPDKGQDWIKELLPYAVVTSITPNQDQPEEELNRTIDGWGYNDRMKAKQEKGTLTLRKFRNIEHLFTLPSIASQVIALAQDELSSTARMARVIESDPVITSKLLKVVNSAFYGFHRQIDSVEHAVRILGNDEVINLSFSIAIRKILQGISSQTARALWEHSLLVAQLSHYLAPRLGCRDGEMSYTLGLLHDLGKIVMLQRNEFYGVWECQSLLSDLAAEEYATGLTHAEIGAYVAERWQLPEGIVEGIIAHHLPNRSANRPLAVAVHLADAVAHSGTLDKDVLNYTATVFLQDKMLAPEVLQQVCVDMRTRVQILLDA